MLLVNATYRRINGLVLGSRHVILECSWFLTQILQLCLQFDSYSNPTKDPGEKHPHRPHDATAWWATPRTKEDSNDTSARVDWSVLSAMTALITFLDNGESDSRHLPPSSRCQIMVLTVCTTEKITASTGLRQHVNYPDWSLQRKLISLDQFLHKIKYGCDLGISLAFA